MKKQIIKLFFGAVLISLSACDQFLSPPNNLLIPDNVVFSSADSTKKAIASIYETFGENNSYRNRLWLQMGLNTDIEYRSGWSAGAVLSSVKSDDYFALYFSNSLVPDGYNSPTSNPWGLIYMGLERANLAIAGIRAYGKPAAGNDMGHYLGEALTMRAFFYYDLIKWWGDVPARFDPVNSKTIYIPKTNRDTIYNQIIKDLQEATTILNGPNTPLTNTTKRISKDAARGLLARICLSAAGYSMRSDGAGGSTITNQTITETRRSELYTIARQACKDIITDGNYKLDPSFKNIFYEQCQDVETHGREAIFQIPYNMGLRGRMVYNLGLPRTADGVLVSGAAASIGGQFKVTPSFFYDYDVNDKRRDITIVPYKVQKSTTVTTAMEQTLSAGIIGFNIAKWRAEWVKTPISGTDDGVSPIVLRYADVLLMYAEVDLYLGLTDGLEKFNMVRRRAFGQAVDSPSPYDLSSLTLAAIQQERAFEFCGENIRKYDLERWGILKSAIDKSSLNLAALRDGTGNYSTVPATIY
jgi:starch-binding outer membrane protein, SusD/RagB family